MDGKIPGLSRQDRPPKITHIVNIEEACHIAQNLQDCQAKHATTTHTAFIIYDIAFEKKSKDGVVTTKGCHKKYT